MSTGKCNARAGIRGRRAKYEGRGVRYLVSRVTTRNDSCEEIALTVQFDPDSAIETEVS